MIAKPLKKKRSWKPCPALVMFFAGIFTLRNSNSIRKALTSPESILGSGYEYAQEYAEAERPRRWKNMPPNPYDTARLPDPSSATFTNYAEALAERLSATERKSVNEFVTTLSQPRCRSDPSARRSLENFLHNHSSATDIENWIHPQQGIMRSVTEEAKVPCDDTFWVKKGYWQPVPLIHHCCHQGTALLRCPVPVVQTSGVEGQSDAPWICPTDMQYDKSSAKLKQQCLAYTFGIANQWEMEDYLAAHNCEVHAHDPTDKDKEAHEKHSVDNVHFYLQGLSAGGNDTNAAMANRPSHYGKLSGDLLTLGNLVRHHGHTGRKIHVLKIDCEGCEWESLHQVATQDPELLESVCTIVMEIHVSNTLHMKSAEQLRHLALVWDHYVHHLGFRISFLHANPGSFRDRKVNPLLLQMGLDPRICCYEVVLQRPNCRL